MLVCVCGFYYVCALACGRPLQFYGGLACVTFPPLDGCCWSAVYVGLCCCFVLDGCCWTAVVGVKPLGSAPGRTAPRQISLLIDRQVNGYQKESVVLGAAQESLARMTIYLC